MGHADGSAPSSTLHGGTTAASTGRSGQAPRGAPTRPWPIASSTAQPSSTPAPRAVNPGHGPARYTPAVIATRGLEVAHPREHLPPEQLERLERLVAADGLENEVQDAAAELVVDRADLAQHRRRAADKQLSKRDPLVEVVRRQPTTLILDVAAVVAEPRRGLVERAVRLREAHPPLRRASGNQIVARLRVRVG